MLTILQTVLGLIPPEKTELLRQQQHKRDQEAEAGAAQWGRTGAIQPHLHSTFSLLPLLSCCCEQEAAESQRGTCCSVQLQNLVLLD